MFQGGYGKAWQYMSASQYILKYKYIIIAVYLIIYGIAMKFYTDIHHPLGSLAIPCFPLTSLLGQTLCLPNTSTVYTFQNKFGVIFGDDAKIVNMLRC